jgi:hypothetical protein
MARRSAASLVAALSLAAVTVTVTVTGAADAAPPRAGLLVAGQSLGGVRLGMTPTQVEAAWGNEFGRCRNCVEPTWYFTYKPFQPYGAGVTFRRGRVDAVFTLWAPAQWRSSNGLRVGDVAARVGSLYGELLEVECGSYSALILHEGRTTTLFYVYGEKVWGFGLNLAAVPACR